MVKLFVVQNQDITNIGFCSTRLIQAIENLEKVVAEAGHDVGMITHTAELFECIDVFQTRIAQHYIQQAGALLEMKILYDTLKVEL